MLNTTHAIVIKTDVPNKNAMKEEKGKEKGPQLYSSGIKYPYPRNGRLRMSEPRALVEHCFRHEFGRRCAVLTRSLGVRRTPTCGKGEMGVQWGHNERGRPMAKNQSTSSNKESRLSIRVDPKRKAVIARAAKQHGHTI